MPQNFTEKYINKDKDQDNDESEHYDNPDLLPIKISRPHPTEDLVLHSGASDTVYRSLKALEGEWRDISNKMLEIVLSASESTLGDIESVTFSLGLNSKGKFVFLAEAGAEASISITFKPTGPSRQQAESAEAAKVKES